MRYAILLVLTLFLSSCSYKSDGYYLLNTAKAINHHKATYRGTLGVAKIELPDYLKGDRLAVKLTPNHIVYRDEKWIEGFGEMLRDRVIKFLKNSLHNQKIYKYPWKVDRVPQKVLKIKILVPSEIEEEYEAPPPGTLTLGDVVVIRRDED